MPAGRLKSLSAAILAALGSAAASGLLVGDAAARVTRKDEETEPVLLLAPAELAAQPLLAHRSHSSHRSHRSHSSGSSGWHASHRSHSSHYSGSGSGSGGGYSGSGGYSGGSSAGSSHDSPATPMPAKPPKPKPPKPGKVSVVAFPGGELFVDGKPVGSDATGVLSLAPGTHTIRVKNRFLGDHETTIEISDGQTGTVKIEW